MIRNATRADIPFMLLMGEEFADDAGVTDWVEWDPASVTELLEFIIDNENAIALVSDNAMFGGFIFPHEFNNKVMVFKEVFWRSKGGGGVKMLKKAEKWAKDKGAKMSGMFTPIKMDPIGVGKLYERLGYQATERIYMRAL